MRTRYRERCPAVSPLWFGQTVVRIAVFVYIISAAYAVRAESAPAEQQSSPPQPGDATADKPSAPAAVPANPASTPAVPAASKAAEPVAPTPPAPTNATPTDPPKPTPPPDAVNKPEPAELPWLATFAAGLEDAREKRRPVLVDVGAEWCGWCKKLDVEIKKPDVQAKLAAWTLVRLDSDKDPDAARKLAVGPIPAMRILSAQGRTISAHDGFFAGDDLVKWLDRFYKGATAGSELLGTEPRDEAEAQALIGHLTAADPVEREAATRRLLRRPEFAAAKAVDAFADGKLAARLAILELLREWKAPLDGVDPWEPATLTPARIDTLKKWSSQVKPPVTSQPAGADAISESDLASARRDIAQMLQADSGAEAQAARERLARYGTALLPEVHTAMTVAATDRDRERLTALRYRVAASDALAVSWSEGFDRLASRDANTRHAAVDELQSKATADDGALLLELFADPDPLVRETSLRALQALGSQGLTLGVVKLLQDPEPNVRAAVLKQLAENPVKGMEAEVVKFVMSEKDPDLIVHAVRVLRETRSKASSKALLSLLSHDSWRVRAEVAEALGKYVDESHGRSNQNDASADELKADIYAAMIKLLEDPDGFVVSRAVLVLRDSGFSAATEPLVDAANRRPELAPDVVQALTRGGASSAKHLREFVTHKSPVVRAAAVSGLVSFDPAGSTKELLAALAEDEPAVRTAATAALIDALEKLRPNPDDQVSSGIFPFNGKKKARDMELWLENFRADGGQDWMKDLVAPLETIVAGKKSGTTPVEVTTAAVVLTAMGHDATGTAIVQQAAKGDGPQRRAAAGALCWMPWEERLALFKDLIANPARDELGLYVQQISRMPNPQLAPLLWDVLGLPAADPELVSEIHRSLQTSYFGGRYYDRTTVTDKKLEPMVKAAMEKLADGSDMQRLQSMALLVENSSKDVIEPAEKLYKDRPPADRIKSDAFQILLLAKHQRDPAEALADARAVLSGAAADTPYEVKKIAVRYLCMGVAALTSLRDSIWLSVSSQSNDSSGQNILIEVPEGLSLDVVRPMLSDTDKLNAAYAGYLACLLGDRAGLDPLLSYWRASQRQSEMRRLAYRAVTVLNDDSLTPVLGEIYKSFSDENYYVREFYWTIRVVKGPNALKLRKQIRDEIGMDQLR